MSKPVIFARGLCFYKVFWIFVTGCVMGVVVENIFCFITQGFFENRSGLIYGPFNPVYGLGAALMTVILYKLFDKPFILLFISGTIVGGVFEYLCSLFLEIFLGNTSWDYSWTMFNINGRIDLFYSMMWGGLAVFWGKAAYPLLSRLIEKIPRKIGVVSTYLMLVFLLFNMFISSAAVYRQTRRMKGIGPENGFEEFLDRHYTDERLKKVYPNMVFVNKQGDS